MDDQKVLDSFINKYKHTLASRLPEMRLSTTEAGQLIAVIAALGVELNEAKKPSEKTFQDKYPGHTSPLDADEVERFIANTEMKLDGGSFKD